MAKPESWPGFRCRSDVAVPDLIRLRTQQFGDDPTYRHDPNNRFASKRTLKAWRKAADKYASRPESMRTAYRALYARQLHMARIFDEEGVKMLAGSDVSGSGWEIPGFALHQEFDQLAAAGLTPLRVLQMTTINAADFLGRTDMGTVDVGKDADIVLLSGTPPRRWPTCTTSPACPGGSLHSSETFLDDRGHRRDAFSGLSPPDR